MKRTLVEAGCYKIVATGAGRGKRQVWLHIDQQSFAIGPVLESEPGRTADQHAQWLAAMLRVALNRMIRNANPKASWSR